MCISTLPTLSQNPLVYKSKVNEAEALSEFMTYFGFQSFAFKIKSNKGLGLNFLIEEYFKDTLVNRFDFFSTKSKYPESLQDKVFFKTQSKTTEFRIYTVLKNDSSYRVMFRFGTVEYIKELSIKNRQYSYEFKEAVIDRKRSFNKNNIVPVLYLTSAVEKDVDGQKVDEFCEVTKIIDDDKDPEDFHVPHYYKIVIQLLE